VNVADLHTIVQCPLRGLEASCCCESETLMRAILGYLRAARSRLRYLSSVCHTRTVGATWIIIPAGHWFATLHLRYQAGRCPAVSSSGCSCSWMGNHLYCLNLGADSELPERGLTLIVTVALPLSPVDYDSIIIMIVMMIT